MYFNLFYAYLTADVSAFLFHHQPSKPLGQPTFYGVGKRLAELKKTKNIINFLMWPKKS
jgi:hypothetical protein